ncbi:MAG TPA: DoxX family protein, partial [Chryseosolibacter sp.]|nr:DoxX family protein [Chryseosolibacter sp.]
LKPFFSAAPLWSFSGLAIIRIMTGLLMTYHGLELFDRSIMEEYLTWDVFKSMPAPAFMIYLGKSLELITGICFIIGLFTRLAAILMMVDMLFICFVVGGGKFYYQDQHPFLFAMIALVFFFTGPARWSLDSRLFGSGSADMPVS